MKNFSLSNKSLILIAFILFFLMIIVYFYAFRSSLDFLNTKNKFSVSENLVPGETTINETEKALGNPESTENINSGSTQLNYSTKSQDYKDQVVVKDNIVNYTIENVFDSRYGFLEDYTKKYGSPNIELFYPGDEVQIWKIFLDGGVGLAIFNENEIAKIIKFKPQSETDFMNNIAKPLGLSKERVIRSD